MTPLEALLCITAWLFGWYTMKFRKDLFFALHLGFRIVIAYIKLFLSGGTLNTILRFRIHGEEKTIIIGGIKLP